MVPYADFERAIARWKIRQAGGEGAVHEVGAEAVVVDESYTVDATVVGENYTVSAGEVVEPSGLITIAAEDDDQK